MMWWLYEGVLFLGLLSALPKALWRQRLPHRGWSMRLGCYPQHLVQALEGRSTLWVHAVSVGEVAASVPLCAALRQAYPEYPLILSTVTPTGFVVASKPADGSAPVGTSGVTTIEVVAECRTRGRPASPAGNVPARSAITGTLPIYFPLDFRACVTRALDTLRPRLLVLIESELWPTVVHLAAARGIPVVLVNGRISGRAFRRYQLVNPWLKGLLGKITLYLMQSQADADRVLHLGAPPDKVRVVGSLKWDACLQNRPSPAAIQDTATRLGLTPEARLIVAGSTHRGEERLLLDAFTTLKAQHRGLRLLLAPRHLERLAEVERLVQRVGCVSRRLSQTAPGEHWEVGLVDTIGELPRYYGLATVVFMGGSLIPHGGQNPLEAASLGKPIVCGPSMENFAQITQQLLSVHGARQLASMSALTGVLSELLTQPQVAHAMGRCAQELTERSQGATQRTLDALRPLIRGTVYSNCLDTLTPCS